MMDEYGVFMDLHQSQLETSAVPKLFWKTLHRKLVHQTFDAGEKFSVFLIDYGDDQRTEHDPKYRVFISSVNGIDSSDPQHIYLIDHAWTFTTRDIQCHLEKIPGLCERLGKLIGCDGNLPSNELIIEVRKQLWKFSQSYSLASCETIEDRMPVWYVMDEFGSAIQHSDEPSFRVVPFIHCPDQMTYSVLFPVCNAVFNEEVTRNFIEGSIFSDEDTRRALLLPWFPSDFTNVSFEQTEPEKVYFLDGHIEESLPDLTFLESLSLETNKEKVWKVFADYKYIHEYLRHPQFILTDVQEEADILFYTTHFKKFEELSLKSPHKFVNQFPFEHILTVKDLLNIVCLRKVGKGVKNFNPETLQTYPIWLPTTFNLKTELSKFVSYYQQRNEKGLDNHWICKPWNLARGLDITVTSNLNHILRLPFTGPKIAQKYMNNPVLFWRPDVAGKVKFDVRYVILLKSVQPLKAYAFRNFFLRFANKPFEMCNFDDNEKHFTVMNYSDAPLFEMRCSEFVVEFENQYPHQKWQTVETEIFSMLRDVFECALNKQPPCGIAHSPQSRAIYAADLMFEWRDNGYHGMNIQPKLLEINWMPDCHRACEYYPDFYNDIFSLLFTGEENELKFRPL